MGSGSSPVSRISAVVFTNTIGCSQEIAFEMAGAYLPKVSTEFARQKAIKSVPAIGG